MPVLPFFLCTAVLGFPPLPPDVVVYSGPVYNSNMSTLEFLISAPPFQKNETNGNGLSVLLPDVAMPAGKAGGNASTNPSAFSGVRSILLVLPVAAGPTDHPYGDGLALVRGIGYHNTQHAVVATPRFTAIPWFCDGNHPTGTQQVLQASYIREVIVRLLQMYCPDENCPVDLIGFSKSGWGAMSLLLADAASAAGSAAVGEVRSGRTATYRRAAVWDAPSMLSLDFCKWMQAPGMYAHMLFVLHMYTAHLSKFAWLRVCTAAPLAHTHGSPLPPLAAARPLLRIVLTHPMRGHVCVALH